jgi:peptidoglycan/xylan/chitin deacetylase (PgdA/CDA1 family)/glycosyltransferase involved in cell wall biosynthesis
MLTIFCLVFFPPASAFCLYFFVLTLVGHWPRQLRHGPTPTHTFAILIPAHDEQQSLPATLRSVIALDYPPDMVRVYVVADNCGDGTATVATEAGVTCMVRNDPDRRGKGFVLAFGLEAIMADGPDAVLVLDADCEIDPGALREIDTVFSAGAEAAQLVLRSANADDGPAGYAVAVGDAVDEFVVAGRDRLGWSVPLHGTGFAVRLSLLRRVPWSAFSVVEDAEYAVRLRAAGVRVRSAAKRVFCAAPPRVRDLCRQRRRWRWAILHCGWMGLPRRAVRSKPLVLAHLFATAAVTLAVGESKFVWLTGILIVLTAVVYLRAVLTVGLTWRRITLLLTTPLVVARLAWLMVAGLMQRQPVDWEYTRPGVPCADVDQPARPAANQLVPDCVCSRFAHRPARLMRFVHRPFVHSRNVRQPYASLTFDDGPHPTHTAVALDQLRRFGVTATFFLVGERIASAPHLPRRIAAEGHTLGNHTFTHPRFGLFDFAKPLREIAHCQQLLSKAVSFRPPFGRMTPGVWLAAQQLGLPVVTWSLDSGDWKCRSESEAVACAHQMLELVRPGDVILLHDNRPWIGVILEVLVPGLVGRRLLSCGHNCVNADHRRYDEHPLQSQLPPVECEGTARIS